MLLLNLLVLLKLSGNGMGLRSLVMFEIIMHNLIMKTSDIVFIIILTVFGDRLKKNISTKLKSIKHWIFILNSAEVHIARIIRSSTTVFNPFRIWLFVKIITLSYNSFLRYSILSSFFYAISCWSLIFSWFYESCLKNE